MVPSSARHDPIFGDFELISILGAGGMAEVYEARRHGILGFKKRLAVKRLRRELCRDPRLVAMFCDEARIHAALSHPNLVQVVEFGEVDGELYLALELVDGFTCAELMNRVAARRRVFELGPALHIAREVLRALAYVHTYRDEQGRQLGLVHRDVAPSNIVIARSGDVKLLDFGITCATLGEHGGRAREIRGKIGYISPEQASLAAVSPASDLFSLSVVLAELLLGEPLFPGETELEILTSLHLGDLRVLERAGARLPPDVRELLERGLAHLPADRFTSARAYLEALDAVMVRHGVDFDAHALSAWMADLGLISIDTHIRNSFATEQKFREASTLSEPVPAPLSPGPQPVAASAASYRIRRAGGTIIGPFSLGKMLELAATGQLGDDTLVSRDGAPFLSRQAVPELSRLSGRATYRFADYVGLRASERLPLVRAAVPRFLFGLSVHRRTGLFCARSKTEQTRIYFENGAPAFSAASDPESLLGALASRAGLLPRERVDELLEASVREGRSLGETLLWRGTLGPAELQRLLDEQRVERMASVCRMHEGELLFVDGELAKESVVTPALRPLESVARAVALAFSGEDISDALRGLEHARLEPSRTGQSAISELNLPAVQARILSTLPPRASLFELMASAGAQSGPHREALLRAVFIGLASGVLEAAE